MTEERDFTFRGLLIESYMAEGLSRLLAEEAVDALLPPPPDESTIEGWLRARYLEITTDLMVWGQHPPPPDPPHLVGIRTVGYVDSEGFLEVIDLPAEAVSVSPPDEKAIDGILHDPLWNLGRRSVPGA